MECIEQFFQPRHEFPRIFTWSVGEVSEAVDDELIVGASGEFLFEQWANSCPRSLSCCEFEQSDFRCEPFVSFLSEAETEIGVCCSVVPVIGYLTLIDSCHELRCCDSILAFLSPEIRNFDEFLLERDVCVGENLLRHLSGSGLCVCIDNDVLCLNRDSVTGTRTTRLRVRHLGCIESSGVYVVKKLCCSERLSVA
jgi:hypothetical protein